VLLTTTTLSVVHTEATGSNNYSPSNYRHNHGQKLEYSNVSGCRAVECIPNVSFIW